jgi:hypothetical protein
MSVLMQRASTSGQRASAKPQTVQISPPAHIVRRQAGANMPTLTQTVEAVGGVALGAGFGALLTLGLFPPYNVLGATLSTIVGAIAAATAPIGTIPGEIGMGMVGEGLTWWIFYLTGHYAEPPSAAGS